MTLAIDIGNTLAKLTVLDGGRLVETRRTEQPSIEALAQLMADYPAIDCAAMIWARRADDLQQYARARVSRFLEVTWATPVPIGNPYTAPETQGADRLAAMVGAATLSPGADVLVVDLGTAITFDLLDAQGEFLGGNISPGANMRLRALNQFTEGVPFQELCEHTELIGTTLQSAIVSGVVNAIVYEAEGYITRLRGLYPGLQVIFAGGDANFFAKRMENPIFAQNAAPAGNTPASPAFPIIVQPDLIAIGLNRILEYNAK